MHCLSTSEKRFLGEYVKKHSEKRWHGSSLLAASIVSIAGLVLFVSATFIALRNLSDYVIRWVMLPGGTAGLVLIMFGMGILFLQRKHDEKQKICSILKKMIGAENPTSQFS